MRAALYRQTPARANIFWSLPWLLRVEAFAYEGQKPAVAVRLHSHHVVDMAAELLYTPAGVDRVGVADAELRAVVGEMLAYLLGAPSAQPHTLGTDSAVLGKAAALGARTCGFRYRPQKPQLILRLPARIVYQFSIGFN